MDSMDIVRYAPQGGGNEILDPETLKSYYELLGEQSNRYALNMLSTDPDMELQAKLYDDINNIKANIDDLVSRIEEDYLSEVQEDLSDEIDIVDLATLYPDLKEEFFNPTYFQYLGKLVQRLVFASDIGNSKLNAWLRTIRYLSSEEFVNTYKASIGNIESILTIKSSINSSYSLQHEYIVGKCLNELRILNKSYAFPYTYNLLTCSPVTNDVGQQNRFCVKDSDNPNTHIVMEYVDNIGTLNDYLGSSIFKYIDFHALLANVFFNLDIANRECGYTHWNLKAKNILIRKVPPSYSTYDKYETMVNNREYFPCIIDNAAASVNVGDYNVGANKDELQNNSNHFEGSPCPLADVYRLLISLYVEKASFTRGLGDERKKAFNFIENLLSNFLDTTAMNILKQNITDYTSKRRKNLPYETEEIILRNFNMRSINDNLKSLTMRDFLGIFAAKDTDAMSINCSKRPPDNIKELSCLGMHCGFLDDEKHVFNEQAYIFSLLRADLYGISAQSLMERYDNAEIADGVNSFLQDTKKSLYELLDMKTSFKKDNKSAEQQMDYMISLWDKMQIVVYRYNIITKYGALFNVDQKEDINLLYNKIFSNIDSMDLIDLCLDVLEEIGYSLDDLMMHPTPTQDSGYLKRLFKQKDAIISLLSNMHEHISSII
jgi:hypothetical protein